MHFLLFSMSVVYVLNTPIPDDGDDATVDQLRKRAKMLNLLKNDRIPWRANIWLRMHQDSDKPKGNNVAGPSVVNMVEHNNSSRYNDNKGKRKHHDNIKVDPNKKSKVTCWKCGKPGYLKKDCKGGKTGNKANGSGTNGSTNSLKGQNMFNKSFQVYYVTYVFEAYFVQDDDVAWWVDSGETVHEYLKFSSGKIVSLFNVLHVLTIRKNLVSSSVLNNCGYKQVIESNKFVLSKHGVFIGFGYLSNQMFRLNIVNDNIASAFMSTSKLNDLILWHARLGHVHFKRMQDMSKDGLILAFDMDTEKCKTCMLNKITKKPFQNVKRKTEVLELIHNDLCDLHATPSLGNKKYFVTFIDDVFRVPNKRNMITPYELWTKRKPNLNYLRVWGCRAVVRLPDPKLKTLDERGIECIFVRYAKHSKAFRFYVIEPNESVSINSIIESRDAIFDENRFSSVPRPSQKSLVKGTEDSDGLVVPEKVTEEVVQQPEHELRKSKRNRTPKDFGPEFQLYLIEGTKDEVSDQHSYCFNVEDDPKTFDEAMKSQDVSFWKEAINDMMDFIMGNNTWVLANLHPCCKPLGCKWIFKRKPKIDGTIEKFKARLVIYGFKQKSRIDYFDTYAPVNLTKELLSSSFSMKDTREADVILVSTLMDTSEKLMPNNVDKLSRYTSNPGTQHWQAIQRVLKYLKKTMEYRLTYTGYPSVLEGYTDASWISNSKDNSSTSGWVILLGGTAAGKESEWLRNLILEIPLWSKPIAPISIRCDSAATLAKAYRQMYNEKSRYLGVRHSMIREMITNRVISIEFVRSQQNLADHLTKGLARDLVIMFAEGIGLKSMNKEESPMPKLLFDIICTLTDVEYVVVHGHIDAEEPEAYQVLESYERAYNMMVIDYCTLRVNNSVAEGRRALICNMWNERIKGTKRNVEYGQYLFKDYNGFSFDLLRQTFPMFCKDAHFAKDYACPLIAIGKWKRRQTIIKTDGYESLENKLVYFS
ncbi:zinc finger, CCHC-type containing protein [Tanacetum coccineum]